MSENLIAVLLLSGYFIPITYNLVMLIIEITKGNKLALKKFLMFLKYSTLILLTFVFTFGVLNHTNYLNYESPLTYDKYEDITFENFRGLELFKKTFYGSKKFAYVVTSIESEIKDNSVTIQSLFYPSRSFVYNKNTNSKELLIHEKYHIKITELFVRKGKQRISNLSNFDEDKISEIIKSIKKEERNFQKKYDYDTFHSYVLSEQKKYEQNVDSLINLLSEFKDTKVKFNEKDKLH
ncbi:hypothetical protein JBL43_10450 [Aureibaculum sp. A20]|uniref:DUF922 domain-containing protein n=1 Tax=Aureibaculum flavum TaxID=2795986 RepID=A0ABS0WRN7_9FLAO|nr:hypothetical protein [Aureibaculum flavum]MBJ2174657.1 hypothetical protein [Aureibaculum flavum]